MPIKQVDRQDQMVSAYERVKLCIGDGKPQFFLWMLREQQFKSKGHLFFLIQDFCFFQ